MAELDSIIEDNKILTSNGTADKLRYYAGHHLRQVYDNEERQNGFLMFIDLVDSTKYKYEYPDLWQKRILHFLMHTQYFFKLLSYQFIKSMGDEVMLFRPFDGSMSIAEMAKYLIRIVFSVSRFLSHEYSIMNPSQVASDYQVGSVHTIRIKITVGEVHNATVFHPYYNENIDLIGEDIDRISRIKQMSSDNLFIADEGFVKALAINGGGFEHFFDDMIWRQKFKGIDDKVRFFAKEMPWD
jgi:beta-glucosidase/6-phospho-beta-glucosidase/beta-galactosidase